MGTDPLTQEAHKVLAPYLVSRAFRKGQLLWSEGDTDGLLVYLKAGRVKIYRLLPTGRAVTLYIFESGVLFGFMPFLDDRPYPAYAQALEACEADVLHRSELRQVLQKDPAVALMLIKQLSSRLREAFGTIERLSSRGTHPKVASAMYGLVAEDARIDDLIVITLPVASHEFAQSLGLTPESFSRGISALVEQGILKRLKTNKFQVLDFAQLQKAAGGAMW
jgi:CRP/FNR family transcriptional regulator